MRGSSSRSLQLVLLLPPLPAGFPASLTGTWRLVFSSPSPIAQWHYIPVREDAVVDVEGGTIDLRSVVGPLDNAFKGQCTFEQGELRGGELDRGRACNRV